jgi:MYXO-CTERM domain-containing protein
VRALASLGFVTLLVSTAHAELPYRIPVSEGRLVVAPPGPVTEPAPTEHVGNVSHIIYLERCKGGCVMHAGADDARGYTSSIPDPTASAPGPDYAITEFENEAGDVGEAADADWAKVLQCVQQVYSPFDVTVTDQKPTAPTYHMNVVAGLSRQVGLSNGILGISPGVGCTPADNHITYTFANMVGGGGDARIWEICAIVAQETAHTWGLDHSYSFGTRSSCIDPMTYRGDCGGQKFFRNDLATCGEYTGRPCACGSTQNAHLLLLNVFGPGTPTTTPPTITVKQPAPGTTTISNGFTVIATAGAQRGIKTVELWLNGYKWANAVGAQWGANGQPTTDYGIPFPANVPDGVIDIVVKAKDDIDVTTESPTITVTKGAPCTSADSCLDGQLGDDCSFPQFCESGLCEGTAERTICTRECVAGVSDSCEAGFECIANGPTKGICFPPAPKDDTICNASVGGDASAPITFVAMSMFGLVLVVRRRKR